jgi:hypothetical protein
MGQQQARIFITHSKPQADKPVALNLALKRMVAGQTAGANAGGDNVQDVPYEEVK